jgi:hypothetical protein
MGTCVRLVVGHQAVSLDAARARDKEMVLQVLVRCIMPGLPASEVLPVVTQVVTFLCINTAQTKAPVLCTFFRDLKAVLVFDDEPTFTPISIVEPMWLQFLFWASGCTPSVAGQLVAAFIDMFALDTYYGIASWFASDLLKKWRAGGAVAVNLMSGTVAIVDVGAGKNGGMRGLPPPTPALVQVLHDVIHDQRGWLEL